MKGKKYEKIKNEYYEYLERSGISIGFQIIFNEIVAKGVPSDKVFEYAAGRLRDFKVLVEKQRMAEQLAKSDL